MKSAKLFLLVFSLLALSSCAGDKMKTVEVDDEGVIDFGRIKEADGPVTMRALVTNHRSDTVKLKSFYSACRCTIVKVPKLTALPKEKQEVLVTYDPAYRRGDIKEEFYLKYNYGGVKQFFVTANVTPCTHPMAEDQPYDYGRGLFMSHSILSYGDMNPGETRDVFIRLGNANERAAEIKFVPEGPYSGCVRFRQPGRMKADERDTIHFKFTMPENLSSGEKVEIPLTSYVNGEKTDSTIFVLGFSK